MTWSNIIGYDIYSPWDIQHRLPHIPPPGTWNIVDGVISQLGWNRPIPDLAGHKTSIEGLYGTGSGWHPIGCGTATGGYTCYRVIADDFGLGKPGEEKGRPLFYKLEEFLKSSIN